MLEVDGEKAVVQVINLDFKLNFFYLEHFVTLVLADLLLIPFENASTKMEKC